MREYTKLGRFALTGAEMRISDPCYDQGTWCAGTVKHCKPGTWDAARVLMKDEPGRTGMLCVKHSSVKGWRLFDGITVDEEYIHYDANWINTGIKVGVDSGQCGFYDEAHYQDESCLKEEDITYDFSGWDDASLWYRTCCQLTLTEPGAGVLPYGVVSDSGYGDGCYDAYLHIRNGEVDALALVFGEVE